MKKPGISENLVNTVYLGLGSNLGKKRKNIELAKSLLISQDIKVLKISSFYKTKSWPDDKFPDYLNVVIKVKTNLKLNDLFKKIKYIEKLLGRLKTKKNYPRICDIDIVDYNGLCDLIEFENNKIIIPHERMHKRNFVLFPLYEITKDWIHPKFKKNIVDLLSKLSIKQLSSIKLI